MSSTKAISKALTKALFFISVGLLSMLSGNGFMRNFSYSIGPRTKRDKDYVLSVAYPFLRKSA